MTDRFTMPDSWYDPPEDPYEGMTDEEIDAQMIADYDRMCDEADRRNDARRDREEDERC